MLTESLVRGAANKCGLALVGVIDREGFDRSTSSQLGFLAQWQQAGFAGEMSYMNRPPELFANLDNFLPGVQTLVLVAVSYSGRRSPPAPHGFGRVARYAWGRDYHLVLRQRLSELGQRLVSENPGRQWRAFSDAVPLLERSLGASAGLGFVGKNSLLIRPGIGSYFFLGELLLTEQVECLLQEQALCGVTGRLQILHDTDNPGQGCGSCERCLLQCPTAAFVGSGVLDARRCISYLTIEKRGEFSDWERRAVSDWIFGCDVCQEVCPFNSTDGEPCWEEFGVTAGVGPLLNLSGILGTASDEAFRSEFMGTAILRAKREGLIRNACAVSANTHCFELVEALSVRATEDVSDLVRKAAYRALVDLEVEAEGVDRVRIRSVIQRLGARKE